MRQANRFAQVLFRTTRLAEEPHERPHHARPRELLAHCYETRRDRSALGLVVEHSAERADPCGYILERNRVTEPARRYEVGERIALRRHDRQPRPKVVDYPRAERK